MRVLSLCVAALVLAAPAAAQDYFPLGDDDVWAYGYIFDPPFSDPDTVRFDPVGVTERVTVHDTAYAVVALPYLPSDTVRTDAEGRVWDRVSGHDVLLLDVTRADGETYDYIDPRDPDLLYTVTVVRPMTVETAGGTFDNVVAFVFDSPEVVDEEFGFALAPGVGIVTAGASMLGSVELFEATVGGQQVTPVETGPAGRVDARAFPNPFASSVTVDLPPGRWRTAEVTDALGRRVATLDVGRCGGGRCTVWWNGAGHPVGVYGIRAVGADGVASIRVTLAR